MLYHMVLYLRLPKNRTIEALQPDAAQFKNIIALGGYAAFSEQDLPRPSRGEWDYSTITIPHTVE
jgi:hypothetical protein